MEHSLFIQFLSLFLGFFWLGVGLSHALYPDLWMEVSSRWIHLGVILISGIFHFTLGAVFLTIGSYFGFCGIIALLLSIALLIKGSICLFCPQWALSWWRIMVLWGDCFFWRVRGGLLAALGLAIIITCF